LTPIYSAHKNPAPGTDWEGALENLIEGRNYVTYDELLALLPVIEEQIDLLDDVLEKLLHAGVTLLNGKETDEMNQPQTRGSPPNLDHIQIDDLLSVYLAEMSQEPLLTFEEEVTLAQQIGTGRQAERALRSIARSSPEYGRLVAQVETGQQARDRLTRANTRLVVSIAKRYRGYGNPFPDLIQEGNLGLMRAVERYDPQSGNRFSTYATWWIRQAVTRSLANQGRVIRIPVHLGERLREMARVGQRLEMVRGHEPSTREIAAAMGVSETQVQQLIGWASQPLSLDQPVGQEEGLELGEMVADQAAAPSETLEELIDHGLLRERLNGLLKKLSAREAKIVRLRYGLDDGEMRTLKEVADKLDLSRERIRQIEREALSKLRTAGAELQLGDFLSPDRGDRGRTF
jgi:RNA polymerase primary sigma factor